MKKTITLLVAVFLAVSTLLIATPVRAVPPPPVEVRVDIKPLSWPNRINVNSRGVIPVAICGADDLDVTQIDPASIRLEGVAPLRWSLEDADLDGIVDLVLIFENQEVVAALSHPISDGDILLLTLTGNLMDEFGGIPIWGVDIVIIIKKR
jgi:hypothetical protein